MSNTSNTRIKLLMTAYSPLRIASSSELVKWSKTLAPASDTLPMELVLGIPVSQENNLQH